MEYSNKKVLSTIGFAFVVLALITLLGPILMDEILPYDVLINIDAMTIIYDLSIYLVPLPFFYLALRKVKTTKIEKSKLNIRNFLILLGIAIFFMNIGNLAGLGITDAIGNFLNSAVVNPLESMDESENIGIAILSFVIFPPIFEELFFRKFLIDRTIRFGLPVSIILSAVLFGLYHANLNQFFYAFLLGGLFAYIYGKTGRIIYTVIFHMILNFYGSIANIPFDSNFFASEFLNNLYYFGYSGFEVIFSLVGIIALIKYRDKFLSLKNRISNAYKTAFINWGMIVFIVMHLGLIILSFYS